MSNEFHTGGINSPHEWNLYVLDNAARFYFWNTFLNGMAERFHLETDNDRLIDRDAVSKITGIDKYTQSFPLWH
jgi:hypothetical protein